MGGARARHLGHEPLSPRALSQFRRRGELEEKHISNRVRLSSSSRGDRISAQHCRPDTETRNPLETEQMDTLQEPGNPPTTEIKVSPASQLKSKTRSAFIATQGHYSLYCMQQLQIRLHSRS